MNTIEAIAARRSIRKFKDVPVEEDKLQAVLRAAVQSPSPKNRQPWRFVVVKGEKKTGMVRAMDEGIANIKSRGEDTGSAEWSAKVMRQAPATVFIFNPKGVRPWLPHSTGQNFDELVDTQAIGAAIQNMLLAAQDLGLGSLWICDVLYSYEELCRWLGEDGELIAAVALGYADEAPAARPRKPMDEVVRIA